MMVDIHYKIDYKQDKFDKMLDFLVVRFKTEIFNNINFIYYNHESIYFSYCSSAFHEYKMNSEKSIIDRILEIDRGAVIYINSVACNKNNNCYKVYYINNNELICDIRDNGFDEIRSSLDFFNVSKNNDEIKMLLNIGRKILEIYRTDGLVKNIVIKVLGNLYISKLSEDVIPEFVEFMNEYDCCVRAYYEGSIYDELNDYGYISDIWKDDKTFIMELVKYDKSTVKYASDRLKDNDIDIINIIKELKKASLFELKYESAKNRNDINVVEEYVDEGHEFRYASDEIKSNKDFILRMIDKSFTPELLLAELSDELQDDDDIINAVKKREEELDKIRKSICNVI